MYEIYNYELIKKESNYLIGTIDKDLKASITGGVLKNNFILIRFHGLYQQYNRDYKKKYFLLKLEPLINFMLRCRLPGGIITSEQWINIDNFTNKYTLYNSIRLTTRQTLQIHGILKNNLFKINKLLIYLGLDSIATAGDINRNILCTSNPLESFIHKEIWLIAKKISNLFLPINNNYIYIWLNNNQIKIKNKKNKKEKILGKIYLPKKFKISIVVPPFNDVDIHANDLSFIAIIIKKKLIGFNVLIGGGLSITLNNKNTFPRLASEIGFIKINDIIKITLTIIQIQKELGNRINRILARTKYTIFNVGVLFYKKEIEKRCNIYFFPIKKYMFLSRNDRWGWIKNINNTWNYTLFIENGRILDSLNNNIKKIIKKIAFIHKGHFRITSNQNIIFTNIHNNKKKYIENILNEYNLINNLLTKQRKTSMACVSFPTCPLAMAEAERFLPQFITKIEKILNSNNILNESIILRVSGCPNGCSRVLLSEIGLIGRTIGKYDLYLGGNNIGTKIPYLYKSNITELEILYIISKTIKLWNKKKKIKECYGKYIIRSGLIKLNFNKIFNK